MFINDLQKLKQIYKNNDVLEIKIERFIKYYEKLQNIEKTLNDDDEINKKIQYFLAGLEAINLISNDKDINIILGILDTKINEIKQLYFDVLKKLKDTNNNQTINTNNQNPQNNKEDNNINNTENNNVADNENNKNNQDNKNNNTEDVDDINFDISSPKKISFINTKYNGYYYVKYFVRIFNYINSKFNNDQLTEEIGNLFKKVLNDYNIFLSRLIYSDKGYIYSVFSQLNKKYFDFVNAIDGTIFTITPKGPNLISVSYVEGSLERIYKAFIQLKKPDDKIKDNDDKDKDNDAKNVDGTLKTLTVDEYVELKNKYIKLANMLKKVNIAIAILYENGDDLLNEQKQLIYKFLNFYAHLLNKVDKKTEYIAISKIKKILDNLDSFLVFSNQTEDKANKLGIKAIQYIKDSTLEIKGLSAYYYKEFLILLDNYLNLYPLVKLIKYGQGKIFMSEAFFYLDKLAKLYNFYASVVNKNTIKNKEVNIQYLYPEIVFHNIKHYKYFLDIIKYGRLSSNQQWLLNYKEEKSLEALEKEYNYDRIEDLKINGYINNANFIKNKGLIEDKDSYLMNIKASNPGLFADYNKDKDSLSSLNELDDFNKNELIKLKKDLIKEKSKANVIALGKRGQTYSILKNDFFYSKEGYLKYGFTYRILLWYFYNLYGFVVAFIKFWIDLLYKYILSTNFVLKLYIVALIGIYGAIILLFLFSPVFRFFVYNSFNNYFDLILPWVKIHNIDILSTISFLFFIVIWFFTTLTISLNIIANKLPSTIIAFLNEDRQSYLILKDMFGQIILLIFIIVLFKLLIYV